MKKLEYSAGNVSKGFWFNEFRKYIELFQDGHTEKEIRQLQKDENIFLAPSEAYGTKKVGEVARRTRTLPTQIIELFLNANISDQKVINLLGIMMTDRLFFEYVYEIYRQNLIMGSEAFEDSDVRIFFRNKTEQSEKVNNFSESAKKRLAGAYKTYLKEANLLVEKDGQLLNNPIILDLDLETLLKEPEMYPYYKAIQGVE